MSYIYGKDRKQMELVCLENSMEKDNEVRKNNIEALQNIFEYFVDFCIKLGLYSKEFIAVDGIKFEASASKKRIISETNLK
jgi:transposase